MLSAFQPKERKILLELSSGIVVSQVFNPETGIEKIGKAGRSTQETFRSFLQELHDNGVSGSSGRELLEKEVLETMRHEGFSDEQIYEMPLVRFLDLFYDAYLQRASRVLSRVKPETFLKGIAAEFGKG